MHPDDLRADLARLGWSQARFAQRLGVSLKTVNSWCNGRRPIPLYVPSWLDVYFDESTRHPAGRP